MTYSKLAGRADSGAYASPPGLPGGIGQDWHHAQLRTPEHYLWRLTSLKRRLRDM